MAEKEKKKTSEFLCRLKYRNTLPEIPVEPKFLHYSFDPQRFVNYSYTTLEKNWSFDLKSDLVHANPIDLVNHKKWSETSEVALEDEELLRGIDKIHGPKQANYSRFHRPEVTWLRRTEYISGDFFRKQERWSERKKERRASSLTNAALDLSTLISSTFVKEPCQHPTKPELYAVETIPLFPDFDLWPYQFFYAIFEPQSKISNDFKNGGVLRSSDSCTRHYVEDGVDSFVFSKNYENPAVVKSDRLNFITVRDGKAFYNPLTAKLHMKRKRGKLDDKPTKIIAKDREWEEEELETQKERKEEGMDYSKWDKFADISDSDEEVHPNIDKASYHKWKRESDLQKRQENLDKMNSLLKLEMTENVQKELDKCKKLEDKYRLRFDELKEKFSYSSQSVSSKPVLDEDAFIKEMEIKAQKFASLIKSSWMQAKIHLAKNPELICDNTETYYLLHFRDMVKNNLLPESKIFSKASLIIKSLIPLSNQARQAFFDKLANEEQFRVQFEKGAEEYWQTAVSKLQELWKEEQ